MSDEHDNSEYRSQAIEDLRHKRLLAAEARIVKDEEVRKAETAYARKPYAEKLRDADYLPEDSGMTVGDKESED